MASSVPSDLDASFVLVNDDYVPSSSASAGTPTPGAMQSRHLNSTLLSPATPSYAHDWSPSGTGGKLSQHGRHFIDAHGRVCHLRGVNLSGNCKTPFPIEDAPQHFARLRRWGLTFVRFLVTWEAVEHAGPGEYDYDYLNYLKQVLALLPQYGLSCFVALHQDVWSRYSGGSGAPAWTIESAGFDLDALEESGSAWLNGLRVKTAEGKYDEEDRGTVKPEERGLWSTGYQKLAAATLATCFWAGDTFAPKAKVKRRTKTGNEEEVSIQQFLQDDFLDMWEVLADTVGHLPGVLGFEIMNEPHRGYVELQSMYGWDYNTDLHLGAIPSPLHSFTLGAGYSTSVPHYTRSFPMPTRHTSSVTLNTAGRKVWREDGVTEGKCIWEMHGVWGWDEQKKEGIVLRENYFKRHPLTGKPVDWYNDFYFPFLSRWADRVRTVVDNDKMVFVEAIPNEFCPSSWTPDHQPGNLVYAPHWYDLNALFNKAFGDFSVNVQGLSRGMFLLKAFYWGHIGARNNFSLQIKNLAEAAYRSLGEKPVLIGECGIPMDMNQGEAFESEDWTWQNRMMDAMITALERSFIGFTLWNYNPSNSDLHGDTWNGENFSFFAQRRALPPSLLTLDQTSPTLDNGARLLRAVVRPYAAKVAGIPLKWKYELNTGDCELEWMVPYSNGHEDSQAKGGPTVDQPPLVGHPTLTSNTTEIFFPHILSQDRTLSVSSPLDSSSASPTFTSEYVPSLQTLYIQQLDMTPGKKYHIKIRLDPSLKQAFELNDFWTDFIGHIYLGGGFIFAIAAWFFVGFL
ncbi:unnamed protein product [Somion occarium]|uniref:Glycoside hydrolase family 5 C-terminal domain-containing protein n=1 Tax=Somion occarium TaxID=3059160 RepID=A0ABP1DTK6_9APHY